MSTKRAARRTKTVAKKKAVKKANRSTADKQKALYESIEKGEYKIKDELTVLKLQKLMYQKQSLEGSLTDLANQHEKLSVKLGQANQVLQGEMEKTAKKFGLAKYHQILLDDENAGKVLVNTQIKAIIEAQEINEKTPEPADSEAKEAKK